MTRGLVAREPQPDHDLTDTAWCSKRQSPLSGPAFEPREEREHSSGAVVGADRAGEFGGAVKVGRPVEAGTRRVVDHQDVVTGRAVLSPAGLDDGTHAARPTATAMAW